MKKRKVKHYSGIGGQAVLEGVMMRNKDMYAVAVRKPDGDIAVEVDEFHGIAYGSVIGKQLIHLFPICIGCIFSDARANYFRSLSEHPFNVIHCVFHRSTSIAAAICRRKKRSDVTAVL